jgi:hypothetical protein
MLKPDLKIGQRWIYHPSQDKDKWNIVEVIDVHPPDVYNTCGKVKVIMLGPKCIWISINSILKSCQLKNNTYYTYLEGQDKPSE